MPPATLEFAFDLGADPQPDSFHCFRAYEEHLETKSGSQELKNSTRQTFLG